MASTRDSEKLSANNAVTMYQHSPGDTAANDVAWVAARDAEHFLVMVMASVLTGTGVTAFSILGNTEADGSGTDVTLKTHAIGSAPDAEGDYIFLEVSADEMAQEAADAGVAGIKGLSASLTHNNAADESAVTYIRAAGRFAHSGLTAQSIA